MSLFPIFYEGLLWCRENCTLVSSACNAVKRAQSESSICKDLFERHKLFSRDLFRKRAIARIDASPTLCTELRICCPHNTKGNLVIEWHRGGGVFQWVCVEKYCPARILWLCSSWYASIFVFWSRGGAGRADSSRSILQALQKSADINSEAVSN